MNKLQTIATSATLSVVAVIGLMAPVFADTAGTTSADKCLLVITHITTIINNLHDVSDKREAAYNDAVARAAKQLKSAQNAGYDSTQLQADYNMLTNDLRQFHTDRQVFEADMTMVQSTSQNDCGTSNSQLMGALITARAALPVLRADDTKLRVDVRQKLITDIRAYIAWLNSKAHPGATTN